MSKSEMDNRRSTRPAVPTQPPVPILFLGDAPTLQTGLGRIGRDLALATSRLPEFRVGFLGRGGMYDRRLPFAQYNYEPSMRSEWGDEVLPQAAANFAGDDERLIIMTLWDPSRIASWFGAPKGQLTKAQSLFFGGMKFKRWGYFAIDGEGPREGGGLTGELAAGLARYDRVLAYSRFGLRVLKATIPNHPDLDWAPHGVNLDVWKPRLRSEARERFSSMAGQILEPGEKLVGCVMSNQPRKDWGVWAEAMREVKREVPRLKLWAHVDSVDRHWDLRALITDFGLENEVTVTADTPSDEEMAWRYSACDLTVLPSRGEGFGYPIVESLACGIPVLHTDYGGGAELLPSKDFAVNSRALELQLDTRWNVYHPVLSPLLWASFITYQLTLKYDDPSHVGGIQCSQSVEHLGWKKLWPSVWKKWMLDGIGGDW